MKRLGIHLSITHYESFNPAFGIQFGEAVHLAGRPDGDSLGFNPAFGIQFGEAQPMVFRAARLAEFQSRVRDSVR